MSLSFTTANPQALLRAFTTGIDEGRIRTWSYDRDGDFTHTPDQWKNKAWLRPSIVAGALVFNIVKPQGINVSTEVYAVYHGRFLEAMLAHCDRLFSDGAASAMAQYGDIIAA